MPPTEVDVDAILAVFNTQVANKEAQNELTMAISPEEQQGESADVHQKQFAAGITRDNKRFLGEWVVLVIASDAIFVVCFGFRFRQSTLLLCVLASPNVQDNPPLALATGINFSVIKPMEDAPLALRIY